MRPTPTLQPASALTSALAQLTALDRGELTVLAAAAQALAAQQPQPQPQPQHKRPDHGPSRAARQLSVRRCRARRKLSRDGDRWNDDEDRDRDGGRDGPDGRDGDATLGDIDVRAIRTIGAVPTAGATIAEATIALGMVAHCAAASSRSAVAADELRLGGRGRLVACADIPGGLTGGPFIDPELFASRAYRRRISCLGEPVPGLLYAAGAPGLLALAKRLDEPLYKVGTTEGATTEMRMSTLGARRYGSVVRNARDAHDGHDGHGQHDTHGWREELGFEHWRAVPLPLSKARAPGSPVRPALKAIAYLRPPTLPHLALDRAVAAMLEPASLATFAASPDGQAACRERALDPASLERYSPAPLGCKQGRYERACELVLLRPRGDADRLAAVLELIIAGHVMGPDSGAWWHRDATSIGVEPV